MLFEAQKKKTKEKKKLTWLCTVRFDFGRA
jgi:hypothetical protein